MKFLLMPDSFKGTLSAEQVCNVMEQEILGEFDDAKIIKVPVADGGEGVVDAFLSAIGGEKVFTPIKGPFFEDISGFFGLAEGGDVAVVEMAAAAGLPLVEGKKNPLKTTTYGVGQVILQALGRGAKRLILGLGGSATNDGGCGMAAALGVRFFDEAGMPFIPVGGTLHKIAKIDASHLAQGVREAEITVMCDIKNPLFGQNGAAYVFAPQKGADSQAVELLDKGLRHLSEVISRDLGIDVAQMEGAGAAGGMGAGAVAFLGAVLRPGIEAVLEAVHFDEIVQGTDYIFTGEGCLDGQSLGGKVADGVARRGKALGIPVIAIVGGVKDGEIGEIYERGVSSVFPISRLPIDFSISRYQSEDNLRFTVRNVVKFIKETRK